MLRGAESSDHFAVLDSDLRFAVGFYPLERFLATQLLKTSCEFISEYAAQGQHFFCLIRCVAVHDALIACAAGVHALCDVIRLSGNRV